MADDEAVKAIPIIMEALTPLDKEAQLHVLGFVIKRLGISFQDSPSPPPIPAGPTSIVNPLVPAPAIHPDIRSLAHEKQPKTVNEKVALVAYFLAHLAPSGERRDHIIGDDIKTYFLQADFELPTATPSMTLTNAKNAGYLNALAERGQYRLNSVGHNLVAHRLPHRDGESTRRATRARPARKTRR